MKGRRVRIPTPGTNARHAFFGALDAVSGRWLWADHDRKLALHFVAFLEHLVTAYPTGVLYLAFDGAPAHTATVVDGGRTLARRPSAGESPAAAHLRCPPPPPTRTTPPSASGA
jgi:hypothetical protein